MSRYKWTITLGVIIVLILIWLVAVPTSIFRKNGREDRCEQAGGTLVNNSVCIDDDALIPGSEWE